MTATQKQLDRWDWVKIIDNLLCQGKVITAEDIYVAFEIESKLALAFKDNNIKKYRKKLFTKTELKDARNANYNYDSLIIGKNVNDPFVQKCKRAKSFEEKNSAVDEHYNKVYGGKCKDAIFFLKAILFTYSDECTLEQEPIPGSLEKFMYWYSKPGFSIFKESKRPDTRLSEFCHSAKKLIQNKELSDLETYLDDMDKKIESLKTSLSQVYVSSIEEALLTKLKELNATIKNGNEGWEIQWATLFSKIKEAYINGRIGYKLYAMVLNCAADNICQCNKNETEYTKRKHTPLPDLAFNFYVQAISVAEQNNDYINEARYLTNLSTALLFSFENLYFNYFGMELEKVWTKITSKNLPLPILNSKVLIAEYYAERNNYDKCNKILCNLLGEPVKIEEPKTSQVKNAPRKSNILKGTKTYASILLMKAESQYAMKHFQEAYDSYCIAYAAIKNIKGEGAATFKNRRMWYIQKRCDEIHIMSKDVKPGNDNIKKISDEIVKQNIKNSTDYANSYENYEKFISTLKVIYIGVRHPIIMNFEVWEAERWLSINLDSKKEYRKSIFKEIIKEYGESK